jgi:hypothetical protein
MNVKNLVLGVGIFIIFMFLLHNGIRAFYDVPKYESYCNSSSFQPYYPDKTAPVIGTNCTYTNQLRQQEQTCYDSQGQPVYEYDNQGCSSRVKECNYCNKYFNDARTEYDKQVFVISLIIGVFVLLAGYLILSIEPVGSSLMASGIGAIIYGTVNNWGNLENLGRFLLLLVAFIILVWVAYRLNKNFDNKKKKR